MTHPSHASPPNALFASSSHADPSSDMPTVWVPMSPSGAQTTSASGRNILALISLIASVIFPLAIAINVLGALAIANHLIPQRAMAIFAMIGGALGTLGIPAMLTAIVTGHVALVIAKRFSRSAARRWMAIVGLIVGYLSLLAFGAVMALFLLAGM
jgi:hypothetical protein